MLAIVYHLKDSIERVACNVNTFELLLFLKKERNMKERTDSASISAKDSIINRFQRALLPLFIIK
jgi:hypothetical protein